MWLYRQIFMIANTSTIRTRVILNQFTRIKQCAVLGKLKCSYDSFGKSDTLSYSDNQMLKEHPEPAFAVDILPFLEPLIDRNEV